MKSSLTLIPFDLLIKFEPQGAWLSHVSEIHGIDHLARVFILQELICGLLEQQGKTVNREAVRWAAMAHDVGRLEDGLDLEHGKRSAQWIKENLHEHMTPELLDMVTYTVHWHVPNDDEAPVMTTELAVLKDADGLDRVRLGDFDASFLRTTAALELVDTAKRLYEESFVHEGENGSFQTVLSAAINMGLVADRV
jgi:hypothetical protein